MTLQVESPTVYTSQGVPISVTGIAQVKIQGQNEDMLLVCKDLFFLVPNKKNFFSLLAIFVDCVRAIFGKIRI